MTNQEIEAKIRRATEADRESLIELFVFAYEDVRAQQFGDILERIWDEWQADLRQEIDIKKVIIAEIDGEAVGVASYKLNDATRIGMVDDNAVLPAYRGRGIGGQLLARVLEIIEAAGMEYAQVSTGLEEPYASACRMYERQGFEPLSCSVSYFKKLAQSAS